MTPEGVRSKENARTLVREAAVELELAIHYAERHPSDPSGSHDLDYRQDNFGEALDCYVRFVTQGVTT
jgi:hypothetical protein